MTATLVNIGFISDLFPHINELQNGSDFMCFFYCLDVHNSHLICATCLQKIWIESLVPGGVSIAVMAQMCPVSHTWSTSVKEVCHRTHFSCRCHMSVLCRPSKTSKAHFCHSQSKTKHICCLPCKKVVYFREKSSFLHHITHSVPWKLQYDPWELIDSSEPDT